MHPVKNHRIVRQAPVLDALHAQRPVATLAPDQAPDPLADRHHPVPQQDASAALSARR